MLGGVLAAGLVLTLRPLSACGIVFLAFGLALLRGGKRLIAFSASIGGLTLALNAFTEPGPVVFRLGPLAMTWTGILAGAERGVRLVGLAAVGWLLVRELGVDRLADFAVRVAGPFERCSMRLAGLGLATGLGLRFLPEIQHEAARIRLAHAARPAREPVFSASVRSWGGSFGGWSRSFGWWCRCFGRWRARLAGLEPLFLPLLSGTVRRAREVARTLDARAYGSGVRTRPAAHPLSAGERWVAWGLVAGAVLTWAADRILSRR